MTHVQNFWENLLIGVSMFAVGIWVGLGIAKQIINEDDTK